MALRITYHGHSCFAIDSDTCKLLIDPYITGNRNADVGTDDLNPDYILVSHAHYDHLGDTVPIAKRSGATVITNLEIANYMEEQGLKAHAMHIGGAHQFPFGKVKLTIAHHGSSFEGGRYGGNPCGFLLWLDGKVLYHAGDTGLFYDMTLIGQAGIDVAMLPVGDNYTMGPEDAVQAVQFLHPKTIILMHYDTFDLIVQDEQAVASLISSQTDTRPVVMRAGETMTV